MISFSKRLSVILALCVFFTAANAQSKSRIFYDGNWKQANSGSAEYFRIITKDNEGNIGPLVKDYYISGELYAIGKASKVNLKDGMDLVREGKWTWFTKEGGRIEEKSYTANVLNGTADEFFPSGNLKSRVIYKDGKPQGGRLIFLETGELESYFDSSAADGTAPTEWFQIRCRKSGLCSRSFSENFEDEESKKFWKLAINSVWGQGLLLKGNSDYISLIRLPFKKDLRFNFGATAARKSGREGWRGLVFGYKDDNNYNVFLVSANGRFAIFRFVSGNVEAMRNWTESAYINRGAGQNRLAVEQNGGETIFQINDNTVATLKGVMFYGDKVGLTAQYEDVVGDSVFTDFFASQSEAKPRYEEPIPSESWRKGSTGFIFYRTGLILTSLGGVSGMKSIQVGFGSGSNLTFYNCELAASDEEANIAILRIRDPKFKPFMDLPYAPISNLPTLGQKAFAIGYPLGVKEVWNGAEIYTGEGTVEQFDADSRLTLYKLNVTTPTQPFSPGSPVFNEKGEILGLVTSAKTGSVEIAAPRSLGKVISTLGERFSSKAKTAPILNEADLVQKMGRQTVLIRGK